MIKLSCYISLDFSKAIFAFASSINHAINVEENPPHPIPETIVNRMHCCGKKVLHTIINREIISNTAYSALFGVNRLTALFVLNS